MFEKNEEENNKDFVRCPKMGRHPRMGEGVLGVFRAKPYHICFSRQIMHYDIIVSLL